MAKTISITAQLITNSLRKIDLDFLTIVGPLYRRKKEVRLSITNHINEQLHKFKMGIIAEHPGFNANDWSVKNVFFHAVKVILLFSLEQSLLSTLNRLLPSGLPNGGNTSGLF